MLIHTPAARSFSDRLASSASSANEDTGHTHQHGHPGDAYQPVSYFDALMRVRSRPSTRRSAGRN